MWMGVLRLVERGIGWVVIVGLVIYLVPTALSWLWNLGCPPERGLDPGDSIATKLRRFRECRDVRCGHDDCQAWNTRRARFCRHCGAALK